MNRTRDKNEVGMLASAQPVLASITSLATFRRDRTVDNWFVALFVVCLCGLSGTLAAKLAPLLAASITNGF